MLFTDDAIKQISERNNLESQYVEKYNDLNLYKEKLRQLNKTSGETFNIISENTIERKVVKKAYLDDNKKIEIIIEDTTTIPLNQGVTRGLPIHYKSEHTVAGVLHFTQHVKYERDIQGPSYVLTKVVDTYGSYTGVLSCSQSSNYSDDKWRENSWARTTFDFTATVASASITAFSSSHHDGYWSTSWE